MTTTLHIANTVRDYATWERTFDKFERFRTENGVKSYRICRQAGDPNQITIDLEFGSTAEAVAFVPKLEQIWSTPQSSEMLTSHQGPEIMELVRHRVLEANLS